jgi:putative Ca2+/H+ antiporter (TMEM165/GDT1 family)
MELPGSSAFILGLMQSYVAIFLSEIGDRTFMMIILLAARKYNPLLIFMMAFIGMCFMHTLSVLVGSLFPTLLPQIVVSILVIVLFVGFGLQ